MGGTIDHAAKNASDASVQPGDILWRHSNPESTQMWHFLQEVNSKYSLNLKTFNELYQWSIDNTADFWKMTWLHVGIQASNTAHLKVGLTIIQ